MLRGPPLSPWDDGGDAGGSGGHPLRSAGVSGESVGPGGPWSGGDGRDPERGGRVEGERRAPGGWPPRHGGPDGRGGGGGGRARRRGRTETRRDDMETAFLSRGTPARVRAS